MTQEQQQPSTVPPVYPPGTAPQPNPPAALPPVGDAQPVGAYPAGAPYPPQGAYLPGAYPPGAYPPQGAYQQPQGAYPQGAYPPPGPYPAYPPGAYPPQPYYAPPAGGPPQTYMTTTVVVTQAAIQFREVPVDVTCGHCNNRVTTKTEYVVGGMVWLICVILILCGCWLGCCLIPFGVDSMKDVEHSCPNCKTKFHRFDRLGGK